MKSKYKIIAFSIITLFIFSCNAKEEKESNRYIHQFSEDGFSVENGRWGPYIKFGKKMINIPKVNDQRVTSEVAATMSLEDFKKIILDQIPTAFDKKKKATATKATGAAKKPAAAKKAAPKKSVKK